MVLMHTQPNLFQVVEDAGREFQGGPEQALVSIAKAELALTRGKVDAALTVLRYCALSCCTFAYCSSVQHLSSIQDSSSVMAVSSMLQQRLSQAKQKVSCVP